MKRWISWILALSLILGAAVLPAAAEGANTAADAVSSASISGGGRRNAPGGPRQGMPPRGGQRPGNTNGETTTPPALPESVNGETATPPALPESANGETATPPDMPESANGEEAARSEAPAEAGNAESGTKQPESGKKKDSRNSMRTGKKSRNTASAAEGITFELLLEKGIITQDIYNAIMTFIREYTAASTAPAAVPAAEASGT